MVNLQSEFYPKYSAPPYTTNEDLTSPNIENKKTCNANNTPVICTDLV